MKNVYCSLPIWQQIVLGLVLGILNNLFNIFIINFHIPLFLDEIFIFAASLFGWCSGFCSVFAFHIICSYMSYALFWSGGISFFSFESLKAFIGDMVGNNGYLFIICSITVVVVVRLYFKAKERRTPAHLLFVGLLLALLISIEGGLVFCFYYYTTSFNERNALGDIEMLLLRHHLPLPMAAILSRIPVNLIDKLIAAFAGFLLAFTIKLGTDRLNAGRIEKEP